jgi:hypothetical protein
MSRLRRSFALAAFAFGLLALSACKPPSNEPTSYDDVTEANFMEGCTGIATSGTAESTSTSVVTTDGASSEVCKCEYDYFVANVPFDQKAAEAQGNKDAPNFQDLNQQLQDNPDSMPQNIQDDLRSKCAEGEQVTPTTSGQPGTTAPPSDTAIDNSTSSTGP